MKAGLFYSDATAKWSCDMAGYTHDFTAKDQTSKDSRQRQRPSDEDEGPAPASDAEEESDNSGRQEDAARSKRSRNRAEAGSASGHKQGDDIDKSTAATANKVVDGQGSSLLSSPPSTVSNVCSVPNCKRRNSKGEVVRALDPPGVVIRTARTTVVFGAVRVTVADNASIGHTMPAQPL